jgi:probable selenium-dependent hydroxylase accessory protein YqeC
LFSENFDFQPHSLVNFVGGGGKTILIHRLMEEYCSDGIVLYTTTTRIHPPAASEGLVVISSGNPSLLKHLVERVSRDCSTRSYKLVATGQFMNPDLLRGVPPDFTTTTNTLLRKRYRILLNEADGAASFSIKIPRKGEPVLMEKAEYLVPVIGIDCLHRPMGPDVIFRWKIFAERFSLQAGEPLTPELASNILMHKQGVCKDYKDGTTIIPFINKVDSPAQDSDARKLASLILHNRNYPVKHVVFGSVIKGRAHSIFAD